jgi:restriction system protein
MIRAKSPASAPRQDGVAGLSWQKFELLIGELYRRQGYEVEVCAADGSDGGVDITLRRGGQTTLVQCKHWKVYRVGVAAVRELFGVLTAEKADQAVLVTSGRFTPDAVAFAAGKPIHLKDGEALRAEIEASKDSVEGDLLQPERWSSAFSAGAVIVDPICPNCRSKMVVRKARRDGKAFWGCSTYPACRGIRNFRPELMGVAAGG